MSFELADEFGKNVRRIYNELDYKIIDVPFADAEERAGFMLKNF